MSFRFSLALALALAPATALAGESSADLEQRIQKVEDELAIQRIIVEYAVRLDARDLDAYLDLFATDGVWQVGDTVRRGREEIREMLASLYGNAEIEPYGYEGFRIIANPQIDVQGNQATARSRHLTLVRGDHGNPTPILSGLYEDVFIRENGEWKIKHRIDHPIMPTAEEWRKQMAERR
jgi:ketosteroid isomerase-like protein